MVHRRQILVKSYQLADLVIMVGTFLSVVYLLAFQDHRPSLEALLEQRFEVLHLLAFLGLIVIWHVILKSFGLYHSRRFSTRRAEAFDVLKATSLGTLVVVNLAIVFEIALGPWRTFAAAFWITATATTIGFRVLVRALLGHFRRIGRNLRNVVIVGTNDRARRFAENIQSRPELGYCVLGFVDESWPGLEQFRAEGGRLVSNLEGLPDFLRRNVVDEVAVALPVNSLYSQGERIIRLCEEQGITVRFLSDLFSLASSRTRVEMFQEHPVITVQAAAMAGWPLLTKRLIDVVGASALLVVLSPLLLVTAALVKVRSPGPVFFVQERLGLNKRRFQLFKFRSMVVDAEAHLKEIEALNETGGPTFKVKNDPRLTPLGRFLRRTSIDELPQLFNVLRGEMSLVGPRPLPERDYAGFSEDWHRRRFSVKPGLTCLWQVSGRSGITFERWMELDMEYIDGWNLWLDVVILLRTVPAVLRGTGAV